MINITLPDGSVKQFQSGATPYDVAVSISEGLARNIISASFNGTTVETKTPLTTDGALVLYTWNDKEGKKHLALYQPRYGTGTAGAVPGY
jgi:threonyl-tRNA synthetase